MRVSSNSKLIRQGKAIHRKTRTGHEHLKQHDPKIDRTEGEPIEDRNWDRLSAPPRLVPTSIRLRLLISKFSFLVVWLIVLGGFAFAAGVGFILTANPEIPFLVGWGLLPAGVVFWLLAAGTLYFRIRATLLVLSQGQLLPGRITQVYDQSTSGYLSYESILEEFSKFADSPYATGVMGSMMHRQLRNWPVKILLENSADEIDGRVDLGRRVKGMIRDPRGQCLVHHQRGKQRGVMLDQFPWLNVSDTGELNYGMRQEAVEFGFGKSLVGALLVVLPTYALVALSLTLQIKPLFDPNMGGAIPPALGAGVVLLFTLTHGVLPVFFYQIFASVVDAAKEHSSQRFNPAALVLSGFFYLHFGFWYGLPILGLAGLTGYLSLAWVAVDVLRAGQGRRRWAFLQHGSTSVALVLFLVCFSVENFFPVGILVVLLQSLLLTVIEWKGKRLWVKEFASE